MPPLGIKGTGLPQPIPRICTGKILSNARQGGVLDTPRPRRMLSKAVPMRPFVRHTLLILIELINKIYKTADEKENAIQAIITNLATFFPNREDGKLVKERFLQKRITEIFVPEYEFLYYMCISQYIGSFSVHSINFGERFQNIAHNEDRHLYYKLLQNLCQETHLNDLGGKVFL